MAIIVLILLLAAVGTNGGFFFPSQAKIEDNTSFDYIIAGGGTAGCVLARRLAEDRTTNVLVLEVGGDPPITSLLSGLFYTLPLTDVDHQYTSVEDPYAASSQGNRTRLTSGKMLGGSASLNHHLWARGVPEDFNNWATVSGDNSWSYEALLPYFIRSEKVNDDKITSMYPSYHGTEGPTVLTRELHDKKVSDYLEALKEVGKPSLEDLNANETIGYGEPTLAIGSLFRQTPAYTYLNPIKDYTNLHVSKNTRVTRIIFEDNKAAGVEAVYDGKTYKFYATKEVILSAGTFNTPQILQLSGVGPRADLESLGINVLADLPVGENLVAPAAVWLVQKTNKYWLPVPDPLNLLGALLAYRIPFPLLVGTETLNEGSTIPDFLTINLLIPHDTPFLGIICPSVYGYSSETCENWQTEVSSTDAMVTVFINLGTESRGSVKLQSTNPEDAPLITTGFFTNENDLKNMVKKIKHFLKIGNSTFFKENDAGVVGLDFEECAGEESGSDAFWECYILKRAISPFIYSSTCPMGTVVDSQLKVKGLKNLRIVDGSVLVDMVHGVPYAAIVALAEKAADMIKSSA